MKVKIEHYRRLQGFPYPMRYYRRAKYNAPHIRGKVETKGGMTRCEIIVGEPGWELHFEGWAYCSDKDNYNYRVGHEIAFGRAVKKLDEHEAEKE